MRSCCTWSRGSSAIARTAPSAPLLARDSRHLAPTARPTPSRLRKGVKFHNGAEMTSADVLWSWNRYMDPKTEWRCLSDFDGRSGLKVEKVEAPDAATVVMTLDRPSALFLDYAGAYRLRHDGHPPQGFGQGGRKLGQADRHRAVQARRVGARRVRARWLASTIINRCRATSRDGYIGAKRRWSTEVKFLVVPDASTVKAAPAPARSISAEIARCDVPELARPIRRGRRRPHAATKHTFLFQTRDPLLKNVKLRQAIAAAHRHAADSSRRSQNGIGKPNNSVDRLDLGLLQGRAEAGLQI